MIGEACAEIHADLVFDAIHLKAFAREKLRPRHTIKIGVLQAIRGTGGRTHIPSACACQAGLNKQFQLARKRVGIR